jgi:hypothetical protein
LATRRRFRDLSSDAFVIREIRALWQDEGLAPSPEPNDEGGQRRGLFRSYEENVDRSDPVRVARVLRVFEVMLQRVSDDDLDTWRQALDRDGYELSAQRRSHGDGRARSRRAVGLPPSLRDPSSILEQFDRIERALATDPALAIGSAKELIEATAKTILVELGRPFDDCTTKLADLISSAQRALHLHPSAATAGPDGTDAVKRILGGLRSIAMGVAELAIADTEPAMPPPALAWVCMPGTRTSRSAPPTPGAH